MTVTQIGNVYTSDNEGDTIAGRDADETMYGRFGNDVLQGMGGTTTFRAGSAMMYLKAVRATTR